MMVRLYYAERSGNCRKVHLALLEVGADYQLVHVDLAARDQKKPEFLAMNPNGKVPTLVDGDFVLWESNAILWYLAEKYPAKRLVPEDHILRARLAQMLFWQTCELQPTVSKLVHAATKEPADPAAVTAAREEVTRVLGVLGGIVAGQTAVVGGELTIADLALGPNVERAVATGVTLPESLTPWLEAMRSRPSWKKVFGERAT
jgi:glutathione S-transferase